MQFGLSVRDLVLQRPYLNADVSMHVGRTCLHLLAQSTDIVFDFVLERIKLAAKALFHVAGGHRVHHSLER